MAASADVTMTAAEIAMRGAADFAKEEAHQGKKETEGEASQINVLFHRRDVFGAGHLTGDVQRDNRKGRICHL